MKSSHLVIELFLGLVFGLWSAGAVAQNPVIYVDCDAGDSLNDAVRVEGDWGQPLRLYVIGTCFESVTVPRNRVTIDGLPPDSVDQGVIEGNIRNWGSSITVRNIRITGEGFGFAASVGRTRLINVDISNNDAEGIVIDGGGTVYLNGSVVRDNGFEGIAVETGFLVVNDTEIAGNEVGIDASMGRLTLEGSSVVENRGTGIIGRLHTAIVANGPAWIERNGEHGVQLEFDSAFVTSGEVSINDNGRFDVVCEDHDSSAKFNDGYPGRVRCPGVRW